MAKKRYTVEEIIRKLHEADVLLGQAADGQDANSGCCRTVSASKRGHVLFYLSNRIGGKLLDSNAIKVIKVAVS